MPNRQRTPEELTFNATVGNNIKYIRKIHGYTQARVGRAIGTTFQQIQKYEKGANGVSSLKLKKMAELFKIKTDVLIDPNFIEYHKGFTGKIEAQELEHQIDEDEKKKVWLKEYEENRKCQ
jgi:transcriptional regulator with XRE-family HTH domain